MVRPQSTIENVFDKPGYAKVLLLLAQGHKTREELIKYGINPHTWYCNYSKLLLKKYKVIKEEEVREGKGRYRNVKYYLIDWKIIIDQMKKMVLRDIN